MWKTYLDQGNFDLAKKYCDGDQEKLSMVRSLWCVVNLDEIQAGLKLNDVLCIVF